MYYYVYSHTTLDSSNVFYIGIGKTVSKTEFSRAHDKKSRSSEWLNFVKAIDFKYKVDILFIYDNSEDCLQKEIELIAQYGRKKFNAGSLLNKAPGGSKWKDVKKVFQYDLEGNFLRKWNSAKEAAYALKVSYTNIYNSCLNKTKVKHFQFRDYYASVIEKYCDERLKKIYIFDRYANFITCCNSGVEAATYLKCTPLAITHALRLKTKVSNCYVSLIRNKCFVKRLIFQYDEQNNLIATYSSLPDVVKKLNLKSHNSIDGALKGKNQKKAYGFVWKEICNTEIDV